MSICQDGCGRSQGVQKRIKQIKMHVHKTNNWETHKHRQINFSDMNAQTVYWVVWFGYHTAGVVLETNCTHSLRKGGERTPGTLSFLHSIKQLTNWSIFSLHGTTLEVVLWSGDIDQFVSCARP